MKEVKFINIFYTRFTWLWFLAILLYGLLITTNPVEAQPFAYVTIEVSNNVSVIGTATNMVVGTPLYRLVLLLVE